TTRLNVRATTHTDATLKAAPADPAVAAGEAKTAAATVLLAGDESVHGELAGVEKEMLVLSAWGGQRLEIPLGDVRGCWLAGGQPGERPKFDERLKAGGEHDWALIMGRDQSAAAVEGSLKSVSDGKLEFVVAGETRKVAINRVLGFVLAAHPARPAANSFYQVVELTGGDKFSAELTSVDAQSIGLRTPWNGELKLPRGSVRAMTCRNGRATYLSDLEPVAVEETAYFTRHLPYRRDESLAGGPLVLDGTTYRKGLAVHSRSLLTYPLDGRYESFQARLGFDDGAPPGGAIACRVLADGRELFANPDLRPDSQPVSLTLDVTGAKQLVLEVDFGPGQDVGDRVTWAGARVFRPAAAGATAAGPKAAAAGATAAKSEPAKPERDR
ncbi:MAG TPA: NPCBM/NEW2 domain-containing protein, partial [Pirellulales bacterium]